VTSPLVVVDDSVEVAEEVEPVRASVAEVVDPESALVVVARPVVVV